MPRAWKDIEIHFGFKLAEKHIKALNDPDDPIHRTVEILLPEGNECTCIFSVNASLREQEWRHWRESIFAFATQGCGDYFVFDTEHANRIYYVDPIGTLEESIVTCEKGGLVFSSFDDRYEHELDDNAQDDVVSD